jgi:RNA polymerase sigma-70 factor, ECF subfamily
MEELRPLLFSLAYRMLGSVSDAEDVVQEAFARYELTTGVESPKAWLTSVVTNLAIDQLRSARARRETYVGEWLPEPLVDGDDPAALAERSDTLSMAFLLLLERLTPVERAVFLLHDVFGYRYDEIAQVVGRSEANLPADRCPRAQPCRGREAALRGVTPRARRARGAFLRGGAGGGRGRARRDARSRRRRRR